jgi:hypothetical protein
MSRSFHFLDDIATADLALDVSGDSLQERSHRRSGFIYKNIWEAVESVDRSGITKTVAELRPIRNIKG